MASEFTSSDSFDEPSLSPPPVPSQRKPWLELRREVWRTRKLATSLVNRVPHSFTFRHIDTATGRRTRLYFLGVPSGNRENTLQFIDIPSSDTFDCTIWESLLESFHTSSSHGQFSKEEQLLRERKRLGSFGITSYDYHESEGKFIFSASSSLFYCTDSLKESPAGAPKENTIGFLGSQPLRVHESKTRCTSTRMDAKMCPQNPRLLAYVSANDIWVTNNDSGYEQRCTFAHKGDVGLREDPLSAGVPSFVVQEEFDRYTGYWWQPGTHHGAGEPVTYRILYEEVDESEVEILTIASPSCDQSGVDEYRYPRAGSPNAACTLKMLEFQLNDRGEMTNMLDLSLEDELRLLFPDVEYIPRAGWTPDGKFVYVQILDRQQQHLNLVLIPYHNFRPPGPGSPEKMETSVDNAGGPVVDTPNVFVIYEESSEIWVNVHDILHFFPQEDPSEISFLWASQKSGYRHLYYVTSRLNDTNTQPAQSSQTGEEVQQNGLHLDPQKASIVREVALTSGDWEVMGKQIWVDEQRKLVYFLGLKDSPLESHLYVVSYASPGSITKLTESGFSHAVSFDKDCSMFVSVYSCISQPPASRLFHIVHSEEAPIQAKAMGALSEAPVLSEEYRPPQLFQYDSESGHRMCGMVYQPHNYEPGQKYPTVMFVYGGPQVQLVTNSYKSIRFLRLHTLASLGYAVIVIDSRGSCNRGLGFESHLKGRLGQVEVSDQVEGLHWLASQADYIDLNRVAIHGWSYGGYLSLMGLCQRPDVFKVAIAGAPVTSWELYDTGYTERYMDTPLNNREGYSAGSVLEQVRNFPSEGNRLLIVHGLIDENVHFFHTSQLINALVKICKPYQLQNCTVNLALSKSILERRDRCMNENSLLSLEYSRKPKSISYLLVPCRHSSPGHQQLYPNERHGIRNPEASEHYETSVLNFLQQNL